MKSKKIILIILGITILFLFICCGSIVFIAFQRVNTIANSYANSVKNILCTSEDEAQNIYNTKTTLSFRKSNSFEEFKVYKKIAERNCNKLENVNAINFLQRDFELIIARSETKNSPEILQFYSKNSENKGKYFLFETQSDMSILLSGVSDIPIE